MSVERTSTSRGFASSQAALFIAGLAILLASTLHWLIAIRGTTDRHNSAREIAREGDRLRATTLAHLRQGLVQHRASLLSGIDRDALKSFATADPRFPARSPGDPTTPGFELVTLTPPSTPDLFAHSASMSIPGGGSPIGSLRQVLHRLSFGYTFVRHRNTSGIDSTAERRSGSFSLHLREVPITEFSGVLWEALDADDGFAFEGPALTMGPVVQSSPAFTLRLSPHQVPDTALGASEKLWEDPTLFASMLVAPDTLTVVGGSEVKPQSLTAHTRILHFDGRALTAEGAIPLGIEVATVDGVSRVLVDLNRIPVTNVKRDANGPDTPGNTLSAYHIECTSALARDRGIAITGTSTARICDVVTTNGAVRLVGSHSGGPLLVGSNFGGVRFLNSGAAVWNAYLLLNSPSPWVSASSAIPAPAGAQPLTLASATYTLGPAEIGFDSIGLRAVPSTGSSSYRIDIGSQNLSAPILWVERSGATVRIGAMTTGAPQFSPTLIAGDGEVELVYSRTHNEARLKHNGASLYWSLPADRPRVESEVIRWSPDFGSLEVLANPCGSALATAAAGEVSIRGLMCNGTLRRFGQGTFRVMTVAGGDVLEEIAPRIVLLDQR